LKKKGYAPKQWTRKQVEEGCDQLVQEGKLVKINPESKEPSWQETEKFLETVWGVTNRYETCDKCKDQVDLMQNEFLRMEVGGYWVYLHAECTLPHIGFFAIKRHYENMKKIKPSRIHLRTMTKAEKELIIRVMKKEFSETKKASDDEREGL
jgi:hypothetical protein